MHSMYLCQELWANLGKPWENFSALLVTKPRPLQEKHYFIWNLCKVSDKYVSTRFFIRKCKFGFSLTSF